MQLRCQDGDLAIILGDLPGGEQNIGRTVEVFGLVETDTTGLPCWLIVPVCADPWVVHNINHRITLEVITLSDRLEHPDQWMLQIRSKGDGLRNDDAEQTAISTLINADKELI